MMCGTVLKNAVCGTETRMKCMYRVGNDVWG